VHHALLLKAHHLVHYVIFRVSPVSSAGIFKFSIWIGIIFLYDSWYLWPVLHHVFIIVVNAAVIAVVSNPEYFIIS
jgi:hypothetical protein